MSSYERALQGVVAQRMMDDASEQDEEAMVQDYQEQVNYDDGMDDLEPTTSISQMPDMQANLMAAATPLEYQATLETKLNSYDNYCNLFHWILNSDGPVDFDIPSVGRHTPQVQRNADRNSRNGPGKSLTNSSINLSHSAGIEIEWLAPTLRAKMRNYFVKARIRGVAILYSTSFIP